MTPFCSTGSLKRTLLFFGIAGHAPYCGIVRFFPHIPLTVEANAALFSFVSNHFHFQDAVDAEVALLLAFEAESRHPGILFAVRV